MDALGGVSCSKDETIADDCKDWRTDPAALDDVLCLPVEPSDCRVEEGAWKFPGEFNGEACAPVTNASAVDNKAPKPVRPWSTFSLETLAIL